MSSIAAPVPTKKRDKLREIEVWAQELWKSENIGMVDVPETATGDSGGDEKFFCTFPYPYMNGRLHLGHAFTLLKAEYAARYQRLKGKKVLFPFAFHCTGMPIQAAANNLNKEIKKYGCPPVYPTVEAASSSKNKSNDKGKGKGKGGKKKAAKLEAKTGKTKSQWKIMQMCEVDEEEIPQFVDPEYWLSYFPPRCQSDLQQLGVHVDWRRSFITTDTNPYYDRFIRWQFSKLKAGNFIAFGKRPTIFSIEDGQACMDHDRSEGEGVGPQEYVLIKLRIKTDGENENSGKPFALPEQLATCPAVAERQARVFLVAATLRPETMYGQTNCFVLPKGEYVAVLEASGDVYICSERSARIMSCQDRLLADGSEYASEFGKPKILCRIKGTDLIGTAVVAPRVQMYSHVYVLALETISMDKGTGVVTSVPSDAPDDYAALKDFKTDEKLRKKYNIEEYMVMPYEVIPIIEVPGIGDRCAVTMCEKLKVKNMRDTKKLKEAKEVCYNKGFYEGTMLVGSLVGEKVEVAKPKYKQEMIDAGEAVKYWEPESEVLSRTGDSCVVALIDQWYIKYGEDAWREQISQHINDKKAFDCFSKQSLNAFNATVGWLRDWACSRSFGLGTRVPWDEQFLIESLSDSTLYFAYYTIAHELQGPDNLDGAKIGPCGIKPDQFTDAVWDYIYIKGSPYPADEANVPDQAVLDRLRVSFNYWYPMDLRVSGKDLIKNHLTMSLYNHAAVWPEESSTRWPKGFFTNGWVLVNGEKMSKGKGNFITLQGACRGADPESCWSADTVRYSLACAGDGLRDANFETKVANAAILELFVEVEWLEKLLTPKENGKEEPMRDEDAELTEVDRIFSNAIDSCVVQSDEAYRTMRYRDVIKFASRNMYRSRNIYRDICTQTNRPLHKALIKKYASVTALIMAPIIPHFAEYVWMKVLKNEKSIAFARWPDITTYDAGVQRGSFFLSDFITKAQKAVARKLAPPKKKKGKKPAQEVPANVESVNLKIYIVDKFPAWKQDLLTTLKELYVSGNESFAKTVMKDMKEFANGNENVSKQVGTGKKALQSVMAAAKWIINDATDEQSGRGLEAFSLEMPFSQSKIIGENEDYITKMIAHILHLKQVTLKVVNYNNDQADDPVNGEKGFENAEPGKPGLEITPA